MLQFRPEQPACFQHILTAVKAPSFFKLFFCWSEKAFKMGLFPSCSLIKKRSSCCEKATHTHTHTSSSNCRPQWEKHDPENSNLTVWSKKIFLLSHWKTLHLSKISLKRPRLFLIKLRLFIWLFSKRGEKLSIFFAPK